jgi:hypothetical protein
MPKSRLLEFVIKELKEVLVPTLLFAIYASAAELNALFGDGELVRILFTRRSSELKLTRRQRIRALAHATLIGIIGGLAMRKTSAKR